MKCPKCGRNIKKPDKELSIEKSVYWCTECDYFFSGSRRNFNEHPFSWKQIRDKNLDIENF